MANVIEHADMPHVWAHTTGLLGALLVYNVVSVIGKHYPNGTLLRLLLQPLTDEPETHQPDHAVK